MAYKKYTYEDWYDGKLDGYSNWLKPSKGEKPTAAHHEGLVDTTELKKIHRKQFECFEKNLELDLEDKKLSFEERYKNESVKKKEKAIKRKIKILENEILKFNNLWIEKAELEHKTVIGFDAETCRKIESKYDLYKNGAHPEKCGAVWPFFINSDGTPTCNQVFELRSKMQFQEYLESYLDKLDLPDPELIANEYVKRPENKAGTKEPLLVYPVMVATRDYIFEHDILTTYNHVPSIQRKIKDTDLGKDALRGMIEFYAERAGLQKEKIRAEKSI